MFPANLIFWSGRNKWDGIKPGREENISPQKNTLGCEILLGKTYRGDSVTAEQGRAPSGGRTGSVSLKAEKGIFVFWGNLSFCRLLLSLFSGMKCLKITNQHTQTLFFSFEVTLKSALSCVHHPWGTYVM